MGFIAELLAPDVVSELLASGDFGGGVGQLVFEGSDQNFPVGGAGGD